jgi:HSP20 family protein
MQQPSPQQNPMSQPQGPFRAQGSMGSMMQAGQGMVGSAGGQQLQRPRVTRQPPVDILDEGENLVLEIEVPGARKDKIQLTGQPNAIRLRAPTREHGEEENLVQSERGQITYQRSIPLTVPIDSEGIEAKFEDGILRVKAPKRDPTSGPRRIEVD